MNKKDFEEFARLTAEAEEFEVKMLEKQNQRNSIVRDNWSEICDAFDKAFAEVYGKPIPQPIIEYSGKIDKQEIIFIAGVWDGDSMDRYYLRYEFGKDGFCVKAKSDKKDKKFIDRVNQLLKGES